MESFGARIAVLWLHYWLTLVSSLCGVKQACCGALVEVAGAWGQLNGLRQSPAPAAQHQPGLQGREQGLVVALSAEAKFRVSKFRVHGKSWYSFTGQGVPSASGLPLARGSGTRNPNDCEHERNVLRRPCCLCLPWLRWGHCLLVTNASNKECQQTQESINDLENCRIMWNTVHGAVYSI